MFRLCGINYIDFWWYTPAETAGMLVVANDKLKFDVIQHAKIITWIANSSHLQKQDKSVWTLNDFLPDFAKGSEKELSPEKAFEMWWNAAE